MVSRIVSHLTVLLSTMRVCATLPQCHTMGHCPCTHFRTQHKSIWNCAPSNVRTKLLCSILLASQAAAFCFQSPSSIPFYNKAGSFAHADSSRSCLFPTAKIFTLFPIALINNNLLTALHIWRLFG